MSCGRYWILGLVMLCLAGPNICDSQDSYWIPSYYNQYPIESNDYAASNVRLTVPSKTYQRYFQPVNSENYSLRRNHLKFPAYPPSYEYDVPSQDIQDQQHSSKEDNTWEEQEILEKLDALETILSDEPKTKNPETKNSINYKIISDSLMSEETKRVVRQVRKDKPGFFWTLARLAFESFNDTKSAVKQISTIISNTIVPDSATTRKPTTSDSLMDASKPTTMTVRQENATTQSTTTAPTTTSTTTEAPRLSTSELQSLIRRNVKGLIRLFNIEWQEALQQSDVTVEEFKKDLGKQVGRYLQDNPNAY